MGGFLDKPKTVKHNDQGEGNKLLFGVSSMQGWRCEMEDAYYARTGLGECLEDWSFFAVFDGHAGCKVSEHCAKHLLEYIIKTDEFQSGDHVRGIRTGFLRIDEVMRKLPEFVSNAEKCGGTTAVCAFVSPNQVYIANCGDSRAVLCRNGVPVFATQDHKPILPEEKERIHRAGGSVMIRRVNGTLAVSRALGDFDYKNVKEKGQCEQLVSPEPEIFCQIREDADEFLVLACDGIWDVMTNEDVCSFIHSRLKITHDLVNISNQVIDTCLHKGSRDNMSIIIIAFPGAPKTTAEDIAAEKRLEKQIEKITREELSNEEHREFVGLLQNLQSREIEGLPPGGGLHSNSRYITPEQQLLITLRFMASGSMQIAVADFMGVSVACVCRILPKVCMALIRHLDEFIKMPRTLLEREEAAAAFYRLAQFPRTIGAIDCTHVKIQSPDGE